MLTNFTVKHGCPYHVTCVICFNLQFIIYLKNVLKCYCNNVKFYQRLVASNVTFKKERINNLSKVIKTQKHYENEQNLLKVNCNNTIILC